MSKRTENNFTKAVNELLGYQAGNSEEDIAEGSIPEDMTPDEDISEGIENSSIDDNWIQPDLSGSFQPFNIPETQSVIAANMEVEGNISTKSDLVISGKIIGDIKCDGNLEIEGSVDGDISAELVVIRGTVIGDIEVSKSVEIQNNAKVKGDILAQSIIISGVTEGDIKAENSVELRDTAVVEGNIYSNKFDVQNGAKLKGMIHTFE